ncbi:MAG: type I restriction endonuclease subunit R [Firmicutes bacterium]|nr:type I restriction endonuclease subunit R [Bacillota bacterium]
MSGYFEREIEKVLIEKLVGVGYRYHPNSDWATSRVLCDFVNQALLLEKLAIINRGVSQKILEQAVKKIMHLDNPSVFAKNQFVHKMIVDGVTIEDHFARVNPHIRFLDFDKVENNTFEIYSQLKFKESRETRIPDCIIYINGLPLVVFELKSLEDRQDTALEQAYKQLGGGGEWDGYRYDIPSLFAYNAFCVISDGATSKVGTITSDWTRYSEWKSKNGETGYQKNYAYKLDVLVEGLLRPQRLLAVLQSSLFFMAAGNKSFKILAQYHQFFGVQKAYDAIVKAVKPKGNGKAGLLWHTQGSGKSFSMVMLASKLIQDTALNNPTVVIVTDRNDLDNQLFATFSHAKDFLRETPKQIDSRAGLIKELSKIKSGGIIFSTIQKFGNEHFVPNTRSNIIVLSDEAHRSHYGIDEKTVVTKDKVSGHFEIENKYGYAKYVRDALPNATFFGFTGTPVSGKDKSTTAIFGEIVDTYDMTQSIEDGSTVKLFYESRLAKVWLDETKIKEVERYFEEIGDRVDDGILESVKKANSRIEVIVGNQDRLKLLAKDILRHYLDRENVLNAKAMIVCMSRKIAFDLYHTMLEMDSTLQGRLAVIATNSNKDTQAERALFGDDAYRKLMAEEFKKVNSKIKMVIVVDMWLTGFDVTDLDVMYIDKPMKSHNLMQAIARVNRVHQGKTSGLIVDYIGIGKALKDALQAFTANDREINLQDVMQVAKDIVLDKLSILKELFYGKVDYQDFFGQVEQKRFASIQNGADFVLGHEKRKKDFLGVTTILKDAFVVALGVADENTKQQVNYFLAVRLFVKKLVSNGGEGTYNPVDINKRVAELIAEAIKGDEITILTQVQDNENNIWELLSEERIAMLRANHPPHIFISIMKKLLSEAIAQYRGYNLVKAKDYTEKLKQLLSTYNHREDDQDIEITILGLVEFSTDMVKSEEYAKKNQLSGRERAFYDALASEKSASDIMGDAVLKIIAAELKEIVEKYATVDWSRKANTKAEMRSQIKRLLKKHNYPPEYEEDAIKRVVDQAEYMM